MKLIHHGMTSTLLRDLMQASLEDPYVVDPKTFWERYTVSRKRHADIFGAAAHGALLQDRLAWVVAMAYQGAIDTVFPTDEPEFRSLCVTETTGNTPSKIEATYDPETRRVRGTKTFATQGAAATSFLVLCEELGGRGDDGRKTMVVVEVGRTRPKVSIEPLPKTPFAPELPHAKVTFDDVLIADDATVHRYGWYNGVRRFRAMEDLFVVGTLAAWMCRWSRITRQGVLARRFATLSIAAQRLVEEEPWQHWFTTGFAGLHDLVTDSVDAFDWCLVAEDVRERWLRDRPILDVARRAREQRIETADVKYELFPTEVLGTWEWFEDEVNRRTLRLLDNGWCAIESHDKKPRPSTPYTQHQRVSEVVANGSAWIPADAFAELRALVAEQAEN